MLGDIISGILPLNALSKFEKPVFDNGIFQLHYRFTVAILITASLLISTKQFFGEPIRCMGEGKPNGIIADSYCWIHGTFTLRNQYAVTEKKIGSYAAHPGVRPRENFDEEISHKYYQWVCVILFLQALMFRLPHFIWKIWEGNRMNSLSSELRTAVINQNNWNEVRRNDMVQYFVEPNGHTFYAIRFMICEVLNLINVVGQIIFLNTFLGASFSDYGPAVASFYFQSNNYNTTDPMAWIFPKVTKCTFQTYGPSGSQQKYDFLCVLPLNIVNEKIFAILWFWFVILALLSGMAVIFRLLTFISPFLRMCCLLSQVRSMPKLRIRNIVKKLTIGNWFVLCQLGRNVNTKVLKDLIADLNCELEGKTALV